MDDKVKETIKRFKETKELLLEFPTKEEAVNYLVNETGISKEECSTAYDFIMKMQLDK